MNNAFDEMSRALEQAAHVNRAADAHAQEMAHMLRGRLQHCKPWTLKALKAELQRFNATTGQWKG